MKMNHTSIFLSSPTPWLWGHLRLPARHSRKFLWPLMIMTSAVNVLHCLAVSRTAARNKAGPARGWLHVQLNRPASVMFHFFPGPATELAISNAYVVSSSSGLVEFPIQHVADTRLRLWKKKFSAGFLGCLVRFHRRDTGHAAHLVTSHDLSRPFLPQMLFGTTFLFKCPFPLQILSSDVLW